MVYSHLRDRIFKQIIKHSKITNYFRITLNCYIITEYYVVPVEVVVNSSSRFSFNKQARKLLTETNPICKWDSVKVCNHVWLIRNLDYIKVSTMFIIALLGCMVK